MNEPKYKVGTTFVANIFEGMPVVDFEWLDSDVRSNKKRYYSRNQMDRFTVSSISTLYYHLINWKTKVSTEWKRSTVESPSFLLHWYIIEPREEN